MVELHEAEKPIFTIIDTVSHCPVSTLDWLPNFPHKAWVDPGEGSFICQVNRREWESNRDRLRSNRSPWPLYHGYTREFKNKPLFTHDAGTDNQEIKTLSYASGTAVIIKMVISCRFCVLDSFSYSPYWFVYIATYFDLSTFFRSLLKSRRRIQRSTLRLLLKNSLLEIFSWK